jgi:hypothetical protein
VVVELELQAACGLMDTLTKRIRQRAPHHEDKGE